MPAAPAAVAAIHVVMGSGLFAFPPTAIVSPCYFPFPKFSAKTSKTMNFCLVVLPVVCFLFFGGVYVVHTHAFANHQVSQVSPNSLHFPTHLAEATFLQDMWYGCETQDVCRKVLAQLNTSAPPLNHTQRWKLTLKVHLESKDVPNFDGMNPLIPGILKYHFDGMNSNWCKQILYMIPLMVAKSGVHQLRLVVYHSLSHVLQGFIYIAGGCPGDFWTEKSSIPIPISQLSIDIKLGRFADAHSAKLVTEAAW